MYDKTCHSMTFSTLTWRKQKLVDMTLKFGNNLIDSTYFALHEAVIEQLSLSEGLSSSTRVVLWKITGTLVQVLGEAFLSSGRSDGGSFVKW